MFSLMATSHMRQKACEHCILSLSLVKKVETVQVHFTLEGEGLKVQKNYHEWKIYMSFYMANYE
jgi:hypothetical protein